MSQSKYLIYFLYLTLGIMTVSCHDNVREIPDVQSIALSNQFIDITEELAGLDTPIQVQNFAQFYQNYSLFNEIYFRNVLRFPQDSLEDLASQVDDWMTHSTYRQLAQIKDSIFEEGYLAQTLTIPFKRMKYYLPIWEEPNVYGYLSEFSIAQFIFDDQERDGFGVGFDYFMGRAIPYKQIDPTNPAFSDYLVRTFNIEHLPKKIIESLLREYMGDYAGDQVIEYMIPEGKILYCLSRVLAETPDSIIHEYTSDQMEWCEQNEYDIWVFLIEENALYSTEITRFNKLISPSPTSPGMPPESPGRTANFIGYKIVEAFMDRNPETSWDELFDTSSKEILNASKYKPRRQ